MYADSLTQTQVLSPQAQYSFLIGRACAMSLVFILRSDGKLYEA